MKAYEPTNIEPKLNEDTFITLLKHETWLSEIFPNAVYLKNSTAWIHWSYYIYYYSKTKNTCYINDLNFYWSLERLSVTNTIEQLSINILPYIKMIQSRTLNTSFQVPQFIYYYNRWYWSKEIVKQAVHLKSLYDEKNQLYWFCEPNWDKGNIIINSDIESWNNKDRENFKSKKAGETIDEKWGAEKGKVEDTDAEIQEGQ